MHSFICAEKKKSFIDGIIKFVKPKKECKNTIFLKLLCCHRNENSYQ